MTTAEAIRRGEQRSKPWPADLPAKPIAGFYQWWLGRPRSEYLPVAVRLYWGPPIDLWTPRFNDRSPRWQIISNGSLIGAPDIEEAWPELREHPISVREYRFMLRRAGWYRQYEPHHLYAMPWKRIDWSTISATRFRRDYL